MGCKVPAMLRFGPQNWGQSPIRGCVGDELTSSGPNWDPTPNLLQRRSKLLH